MEPATPGELTAMMGHSAHRLLQTFVPGCPAVLRQMNLNTQRRLTNGAKVVITTPLM